MALHWTYEDVGEEVDLFQGDLLTPHPDLHADLRDLQPDLVTKPYTAFMVLTQSCDLARRGSRCKASHIACAPVRPLKEVLPELLDAACQRVTHGVYRQGTKLAARQVLERLFNQNEQALGLFYLHADENVSIAIGSVSMLRLQFALPVESYDQLQRARCGRLNAEFRSKLGWLVSILYGRVGTKDWDRAELEGLVDEQLGRQNPLAPEFVHDSWVEAANRKGVDLASLSRADALDVLAAHRPPAAKDQAAAAAVSVAREVFADLSDPDADLLEKHLQNDALFARAVRSARSE